MTTTKQQSPNNYDILYIVLGQLCNFKCRYCIQRDIVTPAVPHQLAASIKEFITSVKPKKIMLWGGEPLLYWKQITELVPYIAASLPNCKINMITNGSLLTEDKVAFINSYNIGVGLSHDGDATSKTRSTDVLKNPNILKLVKQINNKGITTVLSAVTQDLYKHWDYYDTLFGEFININFEPLKDFANDAELSAIDEDKFKRTLQMVSSNFIDSVLSHDFNSREFLFFSKYIRSIHASQLNNSVCNKYKVRCGVFNNALCIDLQGNIYLCKNSDTIVGTINDVSAAESEFAKHISIPQKCQDCVHLPICGNASCVLASHEERCRFCRIEQLIYDVVNETLHKLLTILNSKEHNVHEIHSNLT